MVVWLSCYYFLPVVVVIAYDKMKKFFNKCCKKKVDKKENLQFNKEEIEKLKEKDIDKYDKDIKDNNLKNKIE